MTQFAVYAISIISLFATLGWNTFSDSKLISSLRDASDYNAARNIAESKSPTKFEAPKIIHTDINNNSVLLEPIAGFKGRITKKPFGIFITPETSPVEDDKFNGYHTGVDIEYQDTTEEIPVNAIADGKVVLSRFAEGYGGVVVAVHKIDNADTFVLYGHLKPKTMVQVYSKLKKGETIGYLGDHKSEETDGVRKHLHFAMLKKETLDIRGYVKTLEDLEGWHNPLDFFQSRVTLPFGVTRDS